MKVQVLSRRSRRLGLRASRELPRRTNKAKRQSPVVGGQSSAGRPRHKQSQFWTARLGSAADYAKRTQFRTVGRRESGASGTNEANWRPGDRGDGTNKAHSQTDSQGPGRPGGQCSRWDPSCETKPIRAALGTRHTGRKGRRRCRHPAQACETKPIRGSAGRDGVGARPGGSPLGPHPCGLWPFPMPAVQTKPICHVERVKPRPEKGLRDNR